MRGALLAITGADTPAMTFRPTPDVPRIVLKAFTELRDLRARGIPGLGDSRDDLSDLWLPASWQRATSNLGMTPVEYARWVTIGIWNYANRPEQLAAVYRFKTLAGDRGWLLAAAGLTPEAAEAQIAENGLHAVLEGAEAIVTLTKLGTILDPAWEPSEADEVGEQAGRGPSEPIDFS